MGDTQSTPILSSPSRAVRFYCAPMCTLCCLSFARWSGFPRTQSGRLRCSTAPRSSSALLGCPLRRFPELQSRRARMSTPEETGRQAGRQAGCTLSTLSVYLCDSILLLVIECQWPLLPFLPRSGQCKSMVGSTRSVAEAQHVMAAHSPRCDWADSEQVGVVA